MNNIIHSKLTRYKIFGDLSDQVLKLICPSIQKHKTTSKCITVINKCACTEVTRVITSGFYDPFIGN